MARKKLAVMADQLNENFRQDLPAEFFEKFGVKIEMEWCFFTGGGLQSFRADGEDFSPEQKLFIEAYEAGYLQALHHVRDAI